MTAPLVLTPLPLEPRRPRRALKAPGAKPAKPRRPKVKAEPKAAKVWTHPRKKIAVSHLQMSLPFVGQLI